MELKASRSVPLSTVLYGICLSSQTYTHQIVGLESRLTNPFFTFGHWPHIDEVISSFLVGSSAVGCGRLRLFLDWLE